MMNDFDPDAPPVELLFGRLARPGFTSARTLRRDVARGHLVGVRPGVVASATDWAVTSDLERARARLKAVVHTRRDRVVLSHESAALLWGLPYVGRRPDAVELADTHGTSPRSRNRVAWRRTPFEIDEIVELDGFLVTGLTQTIVDIACTRRFMNAVVAIDAALAGRLEGGRTPPANVEASGLFDRLHADHRRAGRRAERAIHFADGRSESVGESVSRAHMHLLGFPPPVLQVEFDRADGGIDRVDFDWPDHELFGEFDGDGKYLRAEYRRGRSIEEVLLAEKKRADGIRRRHGRRDARWDWRIAISPARLRSALEEAGLPQVRVEQLDW
ncbi:hypothetical protein [Agromyces sp. NPDC049794]|uniref:hypothetical protein n=1 Tax=unclassified Agromyces TaxID=2639701 RepID=UPI0033E22C08